MCLCVCVWLLTQDFNAVRYEIDNDEDAWKEAEKQLAKGGKANPVISVKSSKQKRKAAGQTTAEEVYNEVFGEKKHKKHKKAKK